MPVGESSFGSIRMIAYADGKVKVQNAKNATAMQKALEAAGIVDAFGNKIEEEHQERTSTLTNRDLIAGATGQNDAETKTLKEYQEKLAKRAEQEQTLEDLNKQISQLEAQKDTDSQSKIRQLRDDAIRAKNRKDIYESMLKRMENGILTPIIAREKGRILEKLRKECSSGPCGHGKTTNGTAAWAWTVSSAKSALFPA